LLFEIRSTVRDGFRKNEEEHKTMSKQLTVLGRQNDELSEKMDEQFNSLNKAFSHDFNVNNSAKKISIQKTKRN